MHSVYERYAELFAQRFCYRPNPKRVEMKELWQPSLGDPCKGVEVQEPRNLEDRCTTGGTTSAHPFSAGKWTEIDIGSPRAGSEQEDRCLDTGSYQCLDQTADRCP